MQSTFDQSAILFLNFRGSVAAFRSSCYEYDNILATARDYFRSLQCVPDNNLVLSALIPGHRDEAHEGEVKVSRDVWSSLRDDVRSYPESLTIAVVSDLQDSELAYSESTYSSTAVSSTTGSPGPTLQPAITTWNGAPTHIYLFSPVQLPDVTVQVTLTPSLSFSVVYPSPQGTTIQSGDVPTAAQSLTWAVKAEVGGILEEKSTRVKVSYLYWEADEKTGPGPDLALEDFLLLSPSRPPSPVEDVEHNPGSFDPSRPSTSPYDSVLLPKSDVPDYLDIALKALTLNTEARTSFITYWLPRMIKHEFVALRFIPQKLYEKAAQMSISPKPDVVTRVFMLFHCVPLDSAAHWFPALTAAYVDKTYWTMVVGVDVARAYDPTLFRVLEWGGMEVESC